MSLARLYLCPWLVIEFVFMRAMVYFVVHCFLFALGSLFLNVFFVAGLGSLIFQGVFVFSVWFPWFCVVFLTLELVSLLFNDVFVFWG